VSLLLRDCPTPVVPSWLSRRFAALSARSWSFSPFENSVVLFGFDEGRNGAVSRHHDMFTTRVVVARANRARRRTCPAAGAQQVSEPVLHLPAAHQGVQQRARGVC
jgi:hypothetical protein